jgi:hypothetical protein
MIGREVWSQLDGKIRAMIAVAVLAIVAVVVSDVMAGEDYGDILRHFVMAEIALVFVLYAITIVFGIATWRKRVFDNASSRDLARARLARILGCLIFLVEEAVSLAERFGDTTFNWRTPAVQIGLILWLYAWGFIDTKRVLSLKEVRA